MTISHWLLATRPKTLAAGIIPVCVGSALGTSGALSQAVPLNGLLVACCLIGALCIQVACNFANDALDALKGADTDERIGPRRAVASGLISARAMLIASFALLMLAFFIGLYLASIGGWIIFLLGIISILCAYAYTGGPFPLAYIGLGDVFVFLFFGLFAVLGPAYLQLASGQPEKLMLPDAWWLIASAIGLQATAIIAVNNLRDRKTDALAHKKTLAVRIGGNATRVYIAVLHLCAALCLSLAALYFDNDLLFISASIAGIGGLAISIAIARVEGAALNKFLGITAALELITGLSIAVCLAQ